MELAEQALSLAAEGSWSWTKATATRATTLLTAGAHEEAAPDVRRWLAWRLQDKQTANTDAVLSYLGILLLARGAAELLGFGMAQPKISPRLALDPHISTRRAELEAILGDERFNAARERGACLDSLSAAKLAYESLNSCP